MVKKIDTRVGEDLERESCGHFQYTTPIIIDKLLKKTWVMMPRFEPGTSRMQGLDYSLYADMCHMSLGMIFYYSGLCPFDNTEFEFKLRAPTLWRSHVPPMKYH
jgi:hypothetical protein